MVMFLVGIDITFILWDPPSYQAFLNRESEICNMESNTNLGEEMKPALKKYQFKCRYESANKKDTLSINK